MAKSKQVIHNQETKKAGAYAETLKANSMSSGTFDSAAFDDFMGDSSSEAKVPEKLQAVFDEAGDKASPAIANAILDGVSIYEEQHGVTAPADVVEMAIHQAYATTIEAKKKFALDSAGTDHADNLSLQPRRAIVSILSALTEAIPFAHYLPADIGSNEAKLAILTHQSGSEYGKYLQGASLDGVDSGDAYISSSRVHATTNVAGSHTGQLTSAQDTDETCKTVGGNVVAVNLLRGRSVVYVNGQVAATETSSAGTGQSTVSGSITIAATQYQIGGTINTDTASIALTSTPALANSVPVLVEAFIDYERMPQLTPSIVTSVDTFSLFAKAWRAVSQQTIDSRTQMSNELGLDPISEGIIAIQSQFANERHYEVLRKAKRLGLNNSASFNFNWATMGANKSRSQVWNDFGSTVAAISQQMAVDTKNYGVSHLYVGKFVAAQFLSLPTSIFQPSGVQGRAGIYRLGRLFGLYDVYYTPKVLIDSVSSSQILCIGRANDVTRNPFILGDAVPPTIIPLATGTDLRNGSGFYARNFTEVNPHSASALGCALIDVTNMGL